MIEINITCDDGEAVSMFRQLRDMPGNGYAEQRAEKLEAKLRELQGTLEMTEKQLEANKRERMKYFELWQDAQGELNALRAAMDEEVDDGK